MFLFPHDSRTCVELYFDCNYGHVKKSHGYAFYVVVYLGRSMCVSKIFMTVYNVELLP